MTKDCPDCQAREAEARRKYAEVHCPECDKRLLFNMGIEWRTKPPHVREFGSRLCTDCGWKEVKYDDGEIVTTKGKSDANTDR